MNSLIVKCQQCKKGNKIPADKQHLKPKCGMCGTALSLQGEAIPVHLSDGDFHTFIKKTSLPILVDFFSPTCGPCQSMMPIVDSLARQYWGRSIIVKFDTSTNPQVPAFFNIRGVPTFYFFKRGVLKDQVSGAVAPRVLEEKIKAVFD